MRLEADFCRTLGLVLKKLPIPGDERTGDASAGATGLVGGGQGPQRLPGSRPRRLRRGQLAVARFISLC